MFENIMKIFKKLNKKDSKTVVNSKEAAKERLHLVLMQDRANVSADFLELMKQEIIEVIKKYIDVDENAIDVRLTNKENGDGTNGAPALYANIPILNIKNETKKIESKDKSKDKETDKKSQKINNKEKKVTEKKEESKKTEKNNKTEHEKIEEGKEKKEEKENKKEVKSSDEKIDKKENEIETKEKIKSKE